MPAQPVTEFDATCVPRGREDIAHLIVKAFADAGFGRSQQLAALANAIAESNLDPIAMSVPPDLRVGLFQLNTTVGLGRGRTAAELKDPATNTNIILSEARKHPNFAEASSLEDAVRIFVHTIERPSDRSDEVVRRLKIAEKLGQKS